jgi:hypothetical protein
MDGLLYLNDDDTSLASFSQEVEASGSNNVLLLGNLV